MDTSHQHGKEKARDLDVPLDAYFCYRLADCRLPSSSSAIEPCYPRVSRHIAQNPAEKFLQHDLSCFRVAARRIDALFGIVKGCRSDVFLEDLKSILESWGGWSVTTLYIALLVAPIWRSKCTKNQARTTLMSAIYFSWIYLYPHYFSIICFMSKVLREM